MTPLPSPTGRTRAYLTLGRVSNLPTVWSNVLTGMVLAAFPLAALDMPAPSGARLLFVLAALSAFYTGGMFLNDAFDREYDRAYRHERPIPAGRVTPQEVFGVGFALLAAGEMLLAMPALIAGARPDARTLAAGAALAASIVYYDVRHKRDPLGPLWMAACRALVYIIGALAMTGQVTPRVFAGAAVLASYLVGLTYAAKHESGGANVRGVRLQADLGRLKPAHTIAWPLALVAAPVLYLAPLALRGVVPALFYAAFVLWVAASVRLLRAGGPDVGRAVGRLIAGIALLDAALMMTAPDAGMWPWAAAAAFLLTLLLQRWVPGT